MSTNDNNDNNNSGSKYERSEEKIVHTNYEQYMLLRQSWTCFGLSYHCRRHRHRHHHRKPTHLNLLMRQARHLFFSIVFRMGDIMPGIQHTIIMNARIYNVDYYVISRLFCFLNKFIKCELGFIKCNKMLLYAVRERTGCISHLVCAIAIAIWNFRKTRAHEKSINKTSKLRSQSHIQHVPLI